MEQKLTIADAKKTLASHVEEKGAQLHKKYGPRIGWKELVRILEDREFVRYPTEIAFDVAQLHEGEFAAAIPKTENPEDGYTIFIHPYFSLQPERVPFLVFYHLIVVNYGDFASSEDAEVFGASALGLFKEEYYSTLCRMADEIQ
jgi:hypothetical protein